jgi:hypothetical protein
MKNLVLLACLMAPVAITFSKMSNAKLSVKHIEAINIEMSGDLLTAKSTDPNDPLTLLRVHNRANQIVAQTNCSGTKCTLDLSSLATGWYVAKAYSVQTTASQAIFVP